MDVQTFQGGHESPATIPSRRLVLRGALALALGVVAPFSLVGCNKKGETSTGSPTDTIVTPAANKKMSPADVAYQAQPKAEQRCADCQHFLPETSSCMLVTGQISPQGWCSLWTKKT